MLSRTITIDSIYPNEPKIEKQVISVPGKVKSKCTETNFREQGSLTKKVSFRPVKLLLTDPGRGLLKWLILGQNLPAGLNEAQRLLEQPEIAAWERALLLADSPSLMQKIIKRITERKQDWRKSQLDSDHAIRLRLAKQENTHKQKMLLKKLDLIISKRKELWDAKLVRRINQSRRDFNREVAKLSAAESCGLPYFNSLRYSKMSQLDSLTLNLENLQISERPPLIEVPRSRPIKGLNMRQLSELEAELKQLQSACKPDCSLLVPHQTAEPLVEAPLTPEVHFKEEFEDSCHVSVLTLQKTVVGRAWQLYESDLGPRWSPSSDTTDYQMDDNEEELFALMLHDE